MVAKTAQKQKTRKHKSEKGHCAIQNPFQMKFISHYSNYGVF